MEYDRIVRLRLFKSTCGVGVTKGTSIKKIDLSVFRQVNVRFYKINVC